MTQFPFEVRGVKTYRGHGGEPLRQGNLYYNGEKIGFIGEGDWGGCATLEIKDKKYQKIVDDFVEKHPPVSCEDIGYNTPLKYSDDLFVDDCFAFAEIQKKLKTHKKKGNLCFVVTGDADFTFRFVKVTGSLDKAKEYITTKYSKVGTTVTFL